MSEEISLQTIRAYIAFCKGQKKLSGKTVKAYEIDLRQFTEHIHSSGGEISRENLGAYVEGLHERYKPKTVRRKVASVKAFFNHLTFIEAIPENPLSKVPMSFRMPYVLPRTIPQDVLRRFYATLYNGRGQSHLRDVAAIELLFATGMRISELCSLTPDSVNLSDKHVRIMGKGARERVIQLCNPEVLTALNAYEQAFHPAIKAANFFFVNQLGNRLSEQSVRKTICKCATQAGLTLHITPHMFRHTFATLLLEEDVDIRYIQQILGHTSILTTQIYTHVSSAKQTQILADKHPRNQFRLQTTV